MAIVSQMETQLLRTFLAVVESGSISAAADRLGYVQSSVSEQVRRLERELGVPLLTRTSTGVSPTSEGRRLLPEAELVLAALEELRRTAGGPAPLRIGAVDTLALQWLPDLIASLPPGDQPTIGMERRDLIVRGVAEGRYDVAILYRPRGAPLPNLGAGAQAAVNRLQVEPLDTDELLVVAAPAAAHHTAPWLVTQLGCVHREVFDRQLAPRLPGLRVHAEAGTPDALRRLARQGAGRALLPALAVEADLAAGDLVIDDAADPGEPIEIIAVFDPDAGPEVRRFVRRAIDHAVDRLKARSARPPRAEASR